jgi:hypothetical protein
MICVICREKYYSQSFTEPAEPCACGESAPELWDWKDRVKWLRWRLAMLCFAAGDRLLKWRKR